MLYTEAALTPEETKRNAELGKYLKHYKHLRMARNFETTGGGSIDKGADSIGESSNNVKSLNPLL